MIPTSLCTRALLGSAAAFALVACTSTPPPKGPPLPFHVALLPIHDVVRAGGNADADDATGMTLSIDPGAFAERLAGELESVSFVRVTTLARPGTDDAELIRAARRSGADLVLECELEYSPTIRRERTVFVGLGWLLYALGGPLGIVLDEYRFHADVELRATFHDVWMIDGDEVRVGDRAARVLPVQVNFPGVAMDMIDRSDGMSDYALALVIPAAYVAGESDALQASIHDEVVASLSRQLATAVLERRERLLRSEGVGPFDFRPEQLEIARGDDGSLSVSGQVRLRPGQVVERMSAYRIRVGSTVVEGEFGAGVVESGAASPTLAYEFEEVLQPAPTDATLRLELEAGTRDRYVRSYTFPLVGSLE